MLKRILTAVVAMAVFLPVLYFSYTPAFAIVVSLCAAVAELEMLRCTALWRKWCLTVPLVLLALALPLAAAWPGIAMGVIGYALIAMIVTVLYAFAVMTFSKGSITFSDISVALTGGFYIIAAFTALSVLRYAVAMGEYLYLICFIGAWVTDTFAYFTGMLLGKHKLIPDVSPKKTVEGSVGGVVFCVLSMLLYGYIVSRLTDGAVVANYLVLGISGVLISVVSQIGDLLMSAIKRAYGVKDFGRLFPGHGGVLDRFDSVMAVSLVLFVISTFSNLFTVG